MESSKPLNDSVINGYVPRRDIATILIHFQEHGPEIKSMSELIREVIGQYAKLVVDQLEVPEVLSSEDATRIIREALPKTNLNPGGRNYPYYLKNLQAEEIAFDPMQVPLRKRLTKTDIIQEEEKEAIAGSAQAALTAFRKQRDEQREKENE